MAGYRAELQRIAQDIANLSIADPFSPPTDPERLTRYIYCLYQHASISGDLSKLTAVERAIERAVPGPDGLDHGVKGRARGPPRTPASRARQADQRGGRLIPGGNEATWWQSCKALRSSPI